MRGMGWGKGMAGKRQRGVKPVEGGSWIPLRGGAAIPGKRGEALRERGGDKF